VLVDYILLLKAQRSSLVSNPLLPAYFERLVDAMVYELYFPGSLKLSGIVFLKYLADLPALIKKNNQDAEMQNYISFTGV